MPPWRSSSSLRSAIRESPAIRCSQNSLTFLDCGKRALMPMMAIPSDHRREFDEISGNTADTGGSSSSRKFMKHWLPQTMMLQCSCGRDEMLTTQSWHSETDPQQQ